MAERIATAPRGSGRRLTPRHRANIGAAKRGKRRADVSARQLGKKRPPEVGAKISAAMKGRPGWRVAGAGEVSLGEAVDKYGYTRRALREARSANRIRGRQATRGKKTYILLDHQDASDGFPALERCVAPGCDGPALQDNGGCGRIGHGRIGKPHSAEHRARIAEAKRGKPRPDLAGKPQAPEVIERRAATRKRNHPARRRTCRDCGVAIASGERCRGCAALERWARKEGDRSRALAAAHAGAEKYRRERSERFVDWKAAHGLRDMPEAAAEAIGANGTVRRWARQLGLGMRFARAGSPMWGLTGDEVQIVADVLARRHSPELMRHFAARRDLPHLNRKQIADHYYREFGSKAIYGVSGGRPQGSSLSAGEGRQLLQWRAAGVRVDEIARRLSVSKRTVYRVLAAVPKT